jgi:GT2 family glycosyltransferase
MEGDAIARIRDLFAKHRRLAVASFPQRTDEYPESLRATDFGPPHYAGTYVNCACAFRRSVFCELGGHFGPFWNAYDEPDFAVRCVASGWQVRFDPTVTVRHYFSGVNRNHLRMHHLHARNEIWSVLMRCPMPQMFAVIAFRVARQFGFAWRWNKRWILSEPRWWWQCLAGIPCCLRARAPLAWPRYRAWMGLVRSPLTDEAEWEARFGAR